MSSARRYVFSLDRKEVLLNNTNDNRPSVVRVQFFLNKMIYRYMVALVHSLVRSDYRRPAESWRWLKLLTFLLTLHTWNLVSRANRRKLWLPWESQELNKLTSYILASIVSETKRLLATSRLPNGSTVSIWIRVLAIEPQEFEYNEYEAGRITRADLRKAKPSFHNFCWKITGGSGN